MKNINHFQSRYSKYGYQLDVRKTYENLPCQPFWTWLTGKSLWDHEPKKPAETLLKEWQLWCQLMWSWGIIIFCVYWASIIYNSENISIFYQVPIYGITLILVVNRTRGLLHTFHYTSHGAGIKSKRDKFYATYLMSIPILHTSWDNYRQIHGRDHHSSHSICTDVDPDQIFMKDHRFYRGMTEKKFWLYVVFMPFHFSRIWAHFYFRIEQNFLKVSYKEWIPRSIFWLMFFSMAIYFNVLEELSLFYLFPLLILTQYSSWIQHITEHLWFAKKPESVSQPVYYASLTWGRFLGRPYPIDKAGLSKLWELSKWTTGTLLIDLPLRIFAFMQDLPSHDFHHRSPGVNFWRIAPERAAAENRESQFGPMTETWGIMESIYIVRDALCRDQYDPFGLYAWNIEYQKHETKSFNQCRQNYAI